MVYILEEADDQLISVCVQMGVAILRTEDHPTTVILTL